MQGEQQNWHSVQAELAEEKFRPYSVYIKSDIKHKHSVQNHSVKGVMWTIEFLRDSGRVQ